MGAGALVCEADRLGFTVWRGFDGAAGVCGAALVLGATELAALVELASGADALGAGLHAASSRLAALTAAATP